MKFRGVILNGARRCPACGDDTMREKMPLLLEPVEWVLRDKCSYRRCRDCQRRWLALRGRPPGKSRKRRRS